MRLSTWASGLALLGASVTTGALVVSIDDGSASDGAVSLAAAEMPKIAAIRTGADPGGGERHELYVINADGSGAWRLETARVTPPADEPYELDTGGGNPGPVWSPDGRKIVFVGMGDDGNVDVYVVGADGLGQQRLTHHPGVDGNPAWSPDVRKITFTRRAREWGVGKTHIYVMNADGSGQRRLAEGNVHFSVVWSPDGKKMLFERPDWRLRPVTPGEFAEELYSMNADGSGQRRLTRNRNRDKDPVWSPNGRRIAFPREHDLWVMNPDGSGQRSLTPAAHLWSGGPAWSPDGRKLAFTRRARVWGAGGSAHVYVMNAADGSERRRLTQRGGSPEWSPDGRKIAFDGGQRFRMDRTPPHGIFVMNADGSEQRRLTQSGGSPAWSPDGKMIAFDRSVASGMELVVMTADGSRKRVLMRADSWFRFAWSPRQQ